MPKNPIEEIGQPLGPVFRFQPFLPAGASGLVRTVSADADSLVLDPIGDSPELLHDLVANGNKVISCVPNPVDRLLQSFIFQPPAPQIVRSVFADLAAMRFEGQRLEIHLQEMMRTTCKQCGKPVIVERYSWSEETSQLLTKVYNCQCGMGGEFPVDSADVDLANKWARSDGLYRSAVESLFRELKGVEASDISKYLAIYSPRVLHSLDVLASRVKTTFVEGEKANCARLLVLFTADRCSGMWNLEEGNYRPRMAQTPPVWPETNVWMALNEAYQALLVTSQKYRILAYPDLPQGAGISVYGGSLRELIQHSPKINHTEVMAVLPRPSQAYWVLSAIWSRWILGCSSSEGFLNILRRRRFDWAWYSEVLLALFGRLIPDEGKKTIAAKFLITEPEPEFVLSAVFSLAKAGGKAFSVEPFSNGEVLAITTQFVTVKAERPSKKTISADALAEMLLTNWGDERIAHGYIELLVIILNTIGKDASVLLSYPAEQLKKDLQTVLEGPLFVDVAKRSLVETGVWRIVSSINQSTLDGF